MVDKDTHEHTVSDHCAQLPQGRRDPRVARRQIGIEYPDHEIGDDEKGFLDLHKTGDSLHELLPTIRRFIRVHLQHGKIHYG